LVDFRYAKIFINFSLFISEATSLFIIHFSYDAFAFEIFVAFNPQ